MAKMKVFSLEHRKKISEARKAQRLPYAKRLQLAMKNEPLGRICKNCRELKPIEDFFHRGFVNSKTCNDCDKSHQLSRHKTYYKQNLEKCQKYHREYAKKWRADNKERYCIQEKNRYLKRRKNPAYRQYRKEYAQSERGREVAGRKFNKFVATHPLYSQRYLIGIARKARIYCPLLDFDPNCKVSLDKPLRHNDGNWYDILSEDDKNRRLRFIL